MRHLFVPALVVLLAPLATAAAPIDGADTLDVSFRESGTLTTTAAYEMGDERIDTKGDFTWSVEGSYTFFRSPQTPGTYFSNGDVHVKGHGASERTRTYRGETTTDTCPLDFDDDVLSQAYLTIRDGKLSMTSTHPALTQTRCSASGERPTSVPTYGFAARRVEDASSGAFPASLAVALFLANTEEDWTSWSAADRAQSVLGSGLIEGAFTYGEQTSTTSLSFGAGGLAGLCDLGDPSRHADEAHCTIESTATLDVAPGSFDDAPADEPGAADHGAAADATKGAPGPGLGLALVAVALSAVAFRRR
ncbi:MAG TPA: hypothetical protein VM370_11880 [Candidatus Thermoplasmatota archaeon]|nr:hypothetical protein [Candidatus Thermoplasmatota archaeon]